LLYGIGAAIIGTAVTILSLPIVLVVGVIAGLAAAVGWFAWGNKAIASQLGQNYKSFIETYGSSIGKPGWAIVFMTYYEYFREVSRANPDNALNLALTSTHYFYKKISPKLGIISETNHDHFDERPESTYFGPKKKQYYDYNVGDIMPMGQFQPVFWNEVPTTGEIQESLTTAPVYHPNHTYRGMWMDTSYFSHGYRLTRAYPTLQFLLIDEATRIFGFKMWDDVYGYNAVVSYNKHEDRQSPQSTCVVELSNIYQTLSSSLAIETELAFGEGANDFLREQNILQKMSSLITESAGEAFRNVDTWKIQQLLRSKREKGEVGITLHPGVRLKVLLGYSGNALALKEDFVGTIVDVKHGDVMSVVAQGDGAELNNTMGWAPGKEVAKANIGAEPHKMLIGLFAARGQPGSPPSNWTEMWNAIWGGTAHVENPYGLYHFGEPEYHGFFAENAAGHTLRTMSEISMNIYSTAEAGKLDSPLAEVHKYIGVTDTTDEVNVNIIPSGKTVWEFVNILASANPDFFPAIRPFNFRSTFFFGKHYYPMASGFLPNIQKNHEDLSMLWKFLPAGSTRKITQSVFAGKWGRPTLNKEIFKNKFNPRPLDASSGYAYATVDNLNVVYKTYSQCHVVSDKTNIISNSVYASNENVYNVVTASEPKDANLDSIYKRTVFADREIFPEHWRHIQIDSGMVAKHRILENVFHGPILQNAAVSFCRDSMKKMYQGSYEIVGDPSIKPRDYVFMNDEYTGMFGLHEVRTVVHSLNIYEGFRTYVTPDCLASHGDQETPVIWTWSALNGRRINQLSSMRWNIAEKQQEIDNDIWDQLGWFQFDFTDFASTMTRHGSAGAIAMLLYKYKGDELTLKALNAVFDHASATAAGTLWDDNVVIGKKTIRLLKLNLGDSIKSADDALGLLEDSINVKGGYKQVIENVLEKMGNKQTFETIEEALEFYFNADGPMKLPGSNHSKFINAVDQELFERLKAKHPGLDKISKSDKKKLMKVLREVRDMHFKEIDNLKKHGRRTWLGLKERRIKQVINTLRAEMVGVNDWNRSVTEMLKNADKSSVDDIEKIQKKLLEKGRRETRRSIKALIDKAKNQPKEVSRYLLHVNTANKGKSAIVSKVDDLFKWMSRTKYLSLTGRAGVVFTEGFTGTFGAVFKKLGGPIWTVAIELAIHSLTNYIHRGDIHDQCLIMAPMKLKGREFSAGIIGHQGSVVGDQPGWWDTNRREILSPFSDAYQSGLIQLAERYMYESGMTFEELDMFTGGQ